MNEALQKRQARKGLVPLDESHEAAEKPLPRRFEPWTADPEQLYGQQEIRRLVASGAVERVDPDGVRHTMRDTANSSFGVTKAAADFGFTGDGDGNPTGYSPQDLTIAVIDTGIDPRHPDFAGGKVIAWQDFVNGRVQPYDDEGHGTHVASIAAGVVM